MLYMYLGQCFSNVWDIFGCQKLGCVASIYWVEARGATKYPTVRKNKELPGLK